MTKLLSSLHEVRGYDDLQPILDDLSREALRVAAAEEANAETVQTMHTVLSEARLLLNDLTRREVHFRGTSRHTASRLMELEGNIREIGGVLDQAIKRVRS